MKIGINARLLLERAGGPSRYTRCLIEELAHIDRKNEYFIFVPNNFNFSVKLPANFKIVILKPKTRFIFDYITLPLYSFFHKIDVYIFPKNTFSPLVRGKKIPVYHDIIYFENELNLREYPFFDNLHHKIMIPICSKFSTIDLTVSDFTANRMVELLEIPRSRIKIAKEGIEDKFRPIDKESILRKTTKKYEIQKPFFFYSGSLSPRKNLIRVIKAFLQIKDRIPHNLYLTGGNSWLDDDVIRLIECSEARDRIFTIGYLSEEDLVAMYNLADCYLYPSLYEGFGLPILEAQACGCPVITSNVSSCPEVAGDGAIIVDPYKIDEMANAMIEIVMNKSLRAKLIKKGFANCKKYSWKKMTQDILQMIENIK